MIADVATGDMISASEGGEAKVDSTDVDSGTGGVALGDIISASEDGAATLDLTGVLNLELDGAASISPFPPVEKP